MSIKDKIISFLGWYRSTLIQSGFSDSFSFGRTMSVAYLIPILYVGAILNFTYGFGYFGLNPIVVAVLVFAFILVLSFFVKQEDIFWKKIMAESEVQLSTTQIVINNIFLWIPSILFIISIVK